MLEVTNAPPIDAQAGIERRLARVRAKLRRGLVVQGLNRLLWLALAFAAGDLVLDWLFRFDRAQRGVLLAALVGFLGWALYRWLLKPLTAQVHGDALALAIERTHPRFQERLISGYQLARLQNGEAHGMSPALIRRAALDAARLAQEVSVDQTLDVRRQSRASAQLTLATLVALVFAIGVVLAAPLRLWFSRNLLLSSATWPTATVLEVERLSDDGSVTFPRGQAWTQAVTVGEESREFPAGVKLEIRAKDQQSTLSMQKIDARRFETTFAPVTEPFAFRASGGDGVTPWISVKLVDPPELTEVELLVTPPRYTGESERLLPAGASPYQALPGSSLRIRAVANKVLANAELAFDGQPLMPRSTGATPKAQSIRLIDGDGGLTGVIPPEALVAGDYRFELQDHLGLTSRRPTIFSISKQNDRPPQVELKLRGVGSMVVPAARLAFHASVSDDYGLTSFAAQIRWRAGQQEQAGGQTHLEFESTGERLHQADAAPLRELFVDDHVDLAPLQLAAGASLELAWEAADNDDVSGPKIGRSPELVLRVVTEAELRADLLRREKVLRHEFDALAKEQWELLTETRALAAALGAYAEWSSPQTEQLRALEKRQKLARDRTATIAERFQTMVLEILNNRLEEAGGRVTRRLEDGVVGPLRALAEDVIPACAGALAQTRLAEAGAARDSAFTLAVQRQEGAARRMNAILEQMVQAEGFQEAVNLLYEIEKAQGDVYEQTNRARQERIKQILEGRQPVPHP
jgi:hypothetical protein